MRKFNLLIVLVLLAGAASARKARKPSGPITISRFLAGFVLFVAKIRLFLTLRSFSQRIQHDVVRIRIGEDEFG